MIFFDEPMEGHPSYGLWNCLREYMSDEDLIEVLRMAKSNGKITYRIVATK